jgi:hypothetical protein
MQTDGIPEDMKTLVRSSVTAAEGVARSLGPARTTWTPIAYRLVLAAILRDWSDNGTGQLVEEYLANLKALVGVAATTSEEVGTLDRDATFELVLQGLLADWVDNWGSEGPADEEDEDSEE